jgi:5-methylcytosine-specific restriction endonuclease McrBC GTP-binding regulatory subunit McrB
MEAHDFIGYIVGAGILVISFFLKRVMNQVDNLQKNKEKSYTTIALLRADMDAAKIKLDAHHASIGAQQVQNSKFDILFTQIEGTLQAINKQLERLDK